MPGRTGHYQWARRIAQIFTARPRLCAGLVAGLIAAVLLPAGSRGTMRAILAWDVGVLVYLLLSAMLFTTERIDRMEQDAERQQEGEWTIFSITLAAVAFSFIAITATFAGMKDMPEPEKSLRVGLVAVTLFVSWLMTHTTFAFRYAHEYYARSAPMAKIDRGLEFPEENRPDYLDFMYFSLVLGMTFQVSDVQITSRKFRRLAAMHGLLSFLFNTIILALTVNLAAGLL